MPTRAETAAVFDAIAAEFDASRAKPWPETVFFSSRLPRHARVLDLGCGNGRNVAVLQASGCAVVGLDASRGLLAFAAAKVGTDSLVLGDAVSLPFHPSSFDAVHCVATIHHMPSEEDRRQILSQSARMLPPGGLLLVSAWAAEQDRFRDTMSASSSDVRVPWTRSDGTVVSRFYHLFRTGELDRLVEAGGFAIERAWREGDNHVVLATRE